MVRTYRYPLQPTAAQEVTLLAWLEYCRQLYNAALEHRIAAWRNARVGVTEFDQQKELTEIRADDPEAAAIPLRAQRSALKRLDRSFKAFFRRCKAGEKPGFPRFRGRGRYDSFGIDRPRVEGNKVLVPKLGLVKFRLYRPLQGEIREVTLKVKNGRWWVYFACDAGPAPEKVPVRAATGVDLGLNSFAVLSNGEFFENPRFFKAAEEKLAQRQRRLSRKRRGSRSRERAKMLVGKSHEHIRNQRLDFARKLAKELYDRYELIAYEDLQIRNMTHGRFAKSIADAAWGRFIHALNCKAESAGKWAVPVDPRGTTQRCSGCGEVVRKELHERWHECPCGVSLNRDHNAALNILAAGRAAVALAEAP